MCEEEGYRDQLIPMDCTGFFVGNDIFVTAGHCLGETRAEAKDACKKTNIVFDYGHMELPGGPWLPLDRVFESNIYPCEEVLLWEFDPYRYDADIAVIVLERPVTGRQPLQFRHEGRITTGEEVFSVGHPAGLPLKITTGGFAQTTHLTEQGEFTGPVPDAAMIFTNLDVFGGNSGGPLINVATGMVEGMPSTSSGADFVDFYISGDSGPSCTGVAVCGIDIGCPMYPGTYPIVEYADAIDAFVRGERPLLPAH